VTGDPVVFRGASEPEVTVVMPVYGHGEVVLASLRALRENTSEPIEVVVVDDASPDDAGAVLDENVRGARIIHNPVNLGFGGAVNVGAHAAEGEYLVFLNSDALPQPGWLMPLLETIRDDRNVGAAVSMLIDEQGRIQEAGAAISDEGAPLALGVGCAADDPRFAFRRSVDFGSAACLAIRRDRFLALGGFAPEYGRGYYEDADLAFALAAQGWPTVFVPESRAIHLAGISTGDGKLEATLLENREVFRSRWPAQVRAQEPISHERDSDRAVVQIRDLRAPNRILVIADRATGDETETLARTIVNVTSATRVTLVSRDEPWAFKHLRALRWRGVEVVAGVDPESWLESRRDHYSVLVVPTDVVPKWRAALAATQRAAVRVEVGAAPSAGWAELGIGEIRGSDDARRLLIALGIAPRPEIFSPAASRLPERTRTGF
jgi:GT2 family glycosyltransferase